MFGHHTRLSLREIHEVLQVWAQGDSPQIHWTHIGDVTVHEDGAIMQGDEKIFDLTEYLHRCAIASTVEATCALCGHEETVEPDARGYPCEQCEGEGSISSPLVLAGLA